MRILTYMFNLRVLVQITFRGFKMTLFAQCHSKVHLITVLSKFNKSIVLMYWIS